ncbi:MAG: CpsD/CapB family tyrosine-protein kinase [Hyphococcus sp.]
MDRIREAITRARDRKEALTPQQKPDAQPVAARFSHAPQDDAERFVRVACDFDRFGDHRIISNEQDPVLTAYRVLRTRVLQKMEENDWKTIAVVSPGAGAGKTVTAINLAIAIGSKAHLRPLLIDLDFYRPSVARYLGIKDFPSVLDYFEGKRTLEDVTLRPDLSDMLLIANERVTRRGAEHLSSERADNLIDTAVNDYGSKVVIFDMSPLLGCDDSIAFLPKVDCVLLIAASGDTRVHDLKEARRILGQTNILGTVLNKSPASMMPNQYY